MSRRQSGFQNQKPKKMKSKTKTPGIAEEDFSWIENLLKNRLYFGEDVDWKFSEDFVNPDELDEDAEGDVSFLEAYLDVDLGNLKGRKKTRTKKGR